MADLNWGEWMPDCAVARLAQIVTMLEGMNPKTKSASSGLRRLKARHARRAGETDMDAVYLT
jgi:hypothetical protein